MIINAILLAIGLVGITALSILHTELTCGTTDDCTVGAMPCSAAA